MRCTPTAPAIGVSPAPRRHAPSSPCSRLPRIVPEAASSVYPQQPGSTEYSQPPGKAGAVDPGSTKDSSLGFKRSLWAFIDVVAIFGSVGGAVAALLGIGPTSYVLALPMVLPVVSLVAALNREGLIAEDIRQQYDKLSSVMHMDSQVVVSDAKTAIEEVRRELRSQAAAASRLSSIESRLSSLEGSILSAGRSAREAAAGLSAVPELLQREQRSQYESVVSAVRAELKRAREAWSSEEATALARLDARLAAVEGCLAGLEVAQGENIRRLSLSLNSAIADAEAALQVSVRSEVSQSLEPVRRLPQMLAAVLPSALSSADQLTLESQPRPAPAPQPLSEEVLQAAVRVALNQELQAAVQQILDGQAASLSSLSEVRPTPLAEEQWEALGRRLTKLERLVEAVPQATDAAVRAELEQQLAPALASTSSTIGAQVAESVGSQLADTLGKALNPDQLAEAIGVQLSEAVRVHLTDSIGAQLAGAMDRSVNPDEVVGGISPQVAQAVGATVADAVRVQVEQAMHAQAVAMQAQAREVQELLQAQAQAQTKLMQELVQAQAQELAKAQAQMQAAAVEAAQAAAAAATAGDGVGASRSGAVEEAVFLRQQLAASQEQVVAALRSGREETLAQLSPLVNAVQRLQEQVTQLASQQTAAAQAAAVAATEAAAAAAAAAAQRRESEVASGDGSGQAPSSSTDAQTAVALAGVVSELAAVGEALRQLESKFEKFETQRLAQALLLQQRSAQVQTQASQDSGAEAGGSVGGVGAADSASARQQDAVISGLRRNMEAMQASLRGVETQLAAVSTAPLLSPDAVDGSDVLGADGGVTAVGAVGEEAVPPVAALRTSVVDGDGGAAAAASDADYAAAVGAAVEPEATSKAWAAPVAAATAGPAVAGTAAGAVAEAQQEQQQDWRGSPEGATAAGQQAAMQGGAVATTAAVGREEARYEQYSAGVVAGDAAPSTSYSYSAPGAPAWGQSQYTDSATADATSGEQQYATAAPGGYGDEAAAAGYATAGLDVAQQQLQVDYLPRDITGLSVTEMVSEGLRLLRLGREEARRGQDLGMADRAIDGAINVFREALNVAPEDPKTLGNLGNALLAQGELKCAYLDALMAGPAPVGQLEAEVQRSAESSIRAEAASLLTKAGEMFKRVLELEGWSSRALVNWGRAMCLRAELADAPDLAAQLYSSALDKFEAVLEEDDGMVTAKYRAALAMRGMAKCRAGRPRDAAIMLGDAANYLRDVASASGPDADALRGAAADALAACEAELRNLAAGGGVPANPLGSVDQQQPQQQQQQVQGAAWGAGGGAYGSQQQPPAQGQGYNSVPGQGQAPGQAQSQGGFSLLGWAKLGRRWP